MAIDSSGMLSPWVYVVAYGSMALGGLIEGCWAFGSQTGPLTSDLIAEGWRSVGFKWDGSPNMMLDNSNCFGHGWLFKIWIGLKF